MMWIDRYNSIDPIDTIYYLCVDSFPSTSTLIIIFISFDGFEVSPNSYLSDLSSSSEENIGIEDKNETYSR